MPEADAVFSATIQDDTKVELTDGVKTLWCRGDRLSVFGTNGANYCFSTTDTGATAVFQAEDEQNLEEGLGSSQPFALYPWSDGNSINNDSNLTTYIAAEQYGHVGDYGSQQPVLVGRADADGRISFRHASTVLKISVASEGISRITFKSNGGEPACGTLTADSTGETVSVNGPSEVSFLPPEGDSSFAVGDYCFVIAPGTFSSGVTLSWEPAIDGFSSSKSSSGAVGALPGHLLKCGKVEYVEKAQGYVEPTFGSVDVTGKYDWYGSLTTRQKEFMLPHIQTSFINAEWYFTENLIYIIAGEIADVEDCENVGQEEDGSSHIHATVGYNHIRAVAPLSTIKSSGGEWSYFESYLFNHTEFNYCVSLASDYLCSDYKNDLKESSEYESFKRILGYSNVIISCAANNKVRWNNSPVSLILNEDSDDTEEGVYRSGSVNSNLNNKICVPGYDPDKKNYFGWDGDNDSCRPIGFGKDKHNIVMPMFNLNYDTASSFSTAMLSGTLGNFLSILMKTHPDTTLEGANTILQENYLREEKFKYVDETDGSIKEGGEWYFFDTDKFFEYEVLHKAEMDTALAASGGDIPLPSGYGLCYIGPGIQFEVAGTSYDMTEANRATFEAVWEANPASVKWYFNPTSAAAFGASGSVNVQVRVLDKDARLIPDISRTVSVNL